MAADAIEGAVERLPVAEVCCGLLIRTARRDRPQAARLQIAAESFGGQFSCWYGRWAILPFGPKKEQRRSRDDQYRQHANDARECHVSARPEHGMLPGLRR